MFNECFGYFTVADVNECQINNGGCHSGCTDKVGSYDCSCDSGFVLAADGHSCNGEKQ